MKWILILLMYYMVLDISICNIEIFSSKDDFVSRTIVGLHSKGNFSMKII